MGEVAGDIEFDFVGSLRVARELWALADQLNTTMSARETAGAHAATDWLGPHHDDFVGRMRVERDQRRRSGSATPQCRSGVGGAVAAGDGPAEPDPDGSRMGLAAR